MTQKEQEAKIKEMEEFMKNGVPKIAKTPSSKSDSLHVDVIDMKQREKNNKKSLEVINGNDVQTVLSDASVKAMDGGFDEINKEKVEREKSER